MVKLLIISGLVLMPLLTAMPDDPVSWAFHPLEVEEVPPAKGKQWARNEIDHFILERASEKGVFPNDSADRQTLIRRAYFDLTGLAPSREEVVNFVESKSPGAYGEMIARLLSSSHYGERWGRHWLDVARFGESHGYESDNERPTAWTYRDAVIRALNEDMPFDRFVRWQVAGDVLQGDDPLATALTGFITSGSTVTNVDGVDRERATYDKMDDIVSATGAAFLGLTIGCARCHDHKYDPISQEDYYRLVGFFLPGKAGDRNLAIGDSGNNVKALTWRGGNKRSNPVLKRGDVEQKGGDVGYGVLSALDPGGTDMKRRIEAIGKESSDGRTGLAQWLTDVDSGAGGLLARVIVNRLWQHHFGTGLVKTSNNFGGVGDAPTHPGLLEWLAGKLVSGGWRLKPMHELIMNSAVYRQSTSWDKKRHVANPGNDLLWRRQPLRLEAEILRDSIMNTAGTLNRKLYGPSVKPWVSSDAIKTGSTNKWPTNVKDGPGTWRRSIYVFMRRSMRVPFFETFDVPDGMQSRGVREQTTVATQALLLLNNKFVRDQAGHFAARVVAAAKNAGSPDGGKSLPAIVEEAYWLAFSRGPSKEELDLGVGLLAKEGQNVENFCHILFTLNEFVYVD
ncbi:MAG: DUF1549 domain-containing protein [Verrucomicrobiaceae bacterium]|nr:DUF1549 domain-containing protein [Verrucomicrobiaceae bacterium]